MRTRKVTVALLLAATTGLAATAQAASPPKAGVRLKGKTSQGQRVSGRVTSDGRGLQMTYEETFTCTNGRKFRLPTRYLKQRPTIKRDGSVRYFKTYRNIRGGAAYPGRHTERQRITGSFSKGGTRFTGHAAASLSKRGRPTCRSALKLRLRVVR